MEKRIEKFRNMINLENDEFFVVRIIKRRKDNPEMSVSEKQLKSYNFYSWKDFDKMKNKIVTLCDNENARAYIRLNKLRAADVTLRVVQKMIENLKNGVAYKNNRVWDSESSIGGVNDWWVIDVDSHHIETELEYEGKTYKLLELLETLLENFFMDKYDDYEKIVFRNRTKTGIHLITYRFDKRILAKVNQMLVDKGVETIKAASDGNTILYIGNEMNEF